MPPIHWIKGGRGGAGGCGVSGQEEGLAVEEEEEEEEVLGRY